MGPGADSNQSAQHTVGAEGTVALLFTGRNSLVNAAPSQGRPEVSHVWALTPGL